MKVVALVSGGKDSCYAMMRCLEYGHEIVAVANLLPLEDAIDELDSFMYQTVGHRVVVAFSQCLGLPLFRRRIHGTSRAQELCYSCTKGDEVEDLFFLLKEVKNHFPTLGGVSSGAIASDYQRMRVENVCSRLGLLSLAFLWKQEQTSLLQQMVSSGIDAILVKVASMGLDPQKHLGKSVGLLQPYLAKLRDLYGINVCGEGGEYETLVLDCPLFKDFRISLDEFTIELHSPDNISPVGVLCPLRFQLESKSVNGDKAAVPPLPQVLEVNKNEDEQSLTEQEEIFECMPLNNTEHDHHLSVIRQQHGFVTICCRGGSFISPDQLLDFTLRKIKAALQKEDLDWGDALYIHLYLSDMETFTIANKIYMQHITEKLCARGVPSRSTVEVPLNKCEFGGVMVEVIASKDRSKHVLHVQSISCWAPSCIGPYSQATLHKNLLYMAGQLGLDPATMVLASGGVGGELRQALLNCEAVAQAFSTSIRKSSLGIIIYCSALVGLEQRKEIERVLFCGLSLSAAEENVRPLILYVQVAALPKGALLEIEPYLYAPEFENYRCINNPTSLNIAADEFSLVAVDDYGLDLLSKETSEWCFSNCETCVIRGQCCRVFLSFSYSKESGKVPSKLTVGTMHSGILNGLGAVLKTSLKILSKILDKAGFCWTDILAFRIYFVVETIPVEILVRTIDTVLQEHAMCSTSSRTENSCEHRCPAAAPQPLYIPVLALGFDSSMHDLIAIDLLGTQV